MFYKCTKTYEGMHCSNEITYLSRSTVKIGAHIFSYKLVLSFQTILPIDAIFRNGLFKAKRKKSHTERDNPKTREKNVI